MLRRLSNKLLAGNKFGLLQQEDHRFPRLLDFKSNYHHRRRFNNKDDSSSSDDDDDKFGAHGGAAKFYLDKGRGQHLLTNPRILDSIVQKANIKPTDTVLEIGPGTGNLTLKLLEAAHKVVAIEIDKRMIEILTNRISQTSSAHRITVICDDALKIDFPHFDVVVANIPYSISSPLIAKIVFGANPFRSATLLLQKEFAHRLLASPGDSDYNRLAVNVSLVADVELIMHVSKRDFVPPPKVDSSVVQIHPKPQIPDVNMHEWWAFTRTCFINKNKTLGATLKQKKKVFELFQRSQITSQGVTDYTDQHVTQQDDDGHQHSSSIVCSPAPSTSLFKDKIIGVLKSSGFEDKRPSKLSNTELLQLLALFNQSGIHFHHQPNTKE